MIEHNGKQYKVLGVCAGGIQEDNVTELVQAVVRNAEPLGFRTLVFSTFTDLYKDNAYADGEAGIYSLTDSDLLDALIVMPESIKYDKVTYDIIERAHSRGIPVISMDRRIEGCVSVVFNYGDSFEEIVRHIITVHGCRRFNFMAGFKGNSFSDERISRFKKVLAEEGIEFDEKRLGYGDFWSEPARRVTEQWLERPDELPEAIICANDSMALEVCHVLKEHGLDVPEDIIVTGFDGIDLEKYNTPRLTTCSVNINEAGMAAVSAAVRLTEHQVLPDVLEIPYRIRISQSCGCVPVNMSVIADKVMQLNSDFLLDDNHENYMFTYLARGLSCTKIPKLVEVIHHYCDIQTWCCVDVDYFSDKRSKKRFSGKFTDRMRLLMYTVDPSKNDTLFDTLSLLPDMDETLAELGSLMFAPLHHEDELLGYIAFRLDVAQPHFRFKRRFTMLTNQILESFRIRMLIERANTRLAEMHVHDPMTGLYNRRGFYKNAVKLVRRLARNGRQGVIFSVDMDNLKGINDVYGHDEGDKAIKELAAALVKCSAEGDICSRFGGDEFIVLSASSDEEYIESYGRRIRQALAEHEARARAVFKVEISIGAFSSMLSSAEELDESIRLADERMYSEKRSHKREAPRS
ncbi:MAG: GGDEF domain-containing protein [Ruminococcus sp.]|nr:GGDEF domain-containing protein [Ruminococcus sp.]